MSVGGRSLRGRRGYPVRIAGRMRDDRRDRRGTHGWRENHLLPPPISRGYVAAMATLALPLSQLGHLVAYFFRYGGDGLLRGSQGVHAYLPDLLRLAAGAVGGALLLSLLVVALGRLALGRGLGLESGAREPMLHLFVVAAAVQLDVYIAQETIEALVAGRSLDWTFLRSLLIFGAAGQFPLSLLAAAVVRWLSIRLRVVARALAAPRLVLLPGEAPSLVCLARPWYAVASTGAWPAIHGTRGPPLLLPLV